jgi:hypothetical protein
LILGPVTCECSLLVTYYGTLGRPNPYWLKIIFGVKRNSPFNVSTFAFMTPVYCDYNYSICISSRGNYYTHHIDLLAYRDIQSQRTRIPILEIIQISIAYSAQLISHRLPGWTGKALNQRAAPLRNRKLAKISRNRWSIIPSRRRRSGRAQLLEVNTSGAGECVRRGLEFGLEW